MKESRDLDLIKHQPQLSLSFSYPRNAVGGDETGEVGDRKQIDNTGSDVFAYRREPEGPGRGFSRIIVVASFR